MVDPTPQAQPPRQQDDNLIRLMLNTPPLTGDKDPLVIASKLTQRKLSRKPKYKA